MDQQTQDGFYRGRNDRGQIYHLRMCPALIESARVLFFSPSHSICLFNCGNTIPMFLLLSVLNTLPVVHQKKELLEFSLIGFRRRVVFCLRNVANPSQPRILTPDVGTGMVPFDRLYQSGGAQSHTSYAILSLHTPKSTPLLRPQAWLAIQKSHSFCW